MAGSIREALAEAFDDLESSGGEPPDRSLSPIVDDAPQNDLPPIPSGKEEGSNIDEILETAAPQQQTPPVRKSETLARVRAAQRVSPQAKAPDAAPSPTDAPAVRPSKAPQSWKPAMREQFGKLPADMQAEIVRRETETGRVLNESASSRKFHQDFSQVIRPFEALIAGSGVHPLRAVQNLMATAATLQTGTQTQKAHTLANIIKAYGVDINTLDQVLSGQKPKEGQRQNEELLGMVRRELAPVREFMSRGTQQQQQEQQRIDYEAGQTLEQFSADPKNEYYEDLREDMADFLDMATSRGRVMSVKEAYDRAAASHPEISKLVAKKAALEKAQANRGNVNRARRAASSQGNGSPGSIGGNSPAPKNLRSAIYQAWDDLSAGA
jgi:hypothetical protein